jgi:hypothetical protein
MALHRAQPALLRDDDRDRLLLDHRLVDVDIDLSGASAKVGAALAERRFLGELLRGRRRPSQRRSSTAGLEPSSASICRLLLRQRVESLRISISSSLRSERRRMLRIASACTSVSEAGHQHLLRLVLLADDADHLVDVEIGDQIAAEDLQSRSISASRCSRAAHQHLAAMVEPFAQHLLQRQTFGTLPRDSTFMLSGMRLRARSA